MIITVDFDGTIVEHMYPKIGKPFPFAFDASKAIQNKGHQINLWTYGTDMELDKALKYCHSYGLEFYAVNKKLFLGKFILIYTLMIEILEVFLPGEKFTD